MTTAREKFISDNLRHLAAQLRAEADRLEADAQRAREAATALVGTAKKRAGKKKVTK